MVASALKAVLARQVKKCDEDAREGGNPAQLASGGDEYASPPARAPAPCACVCVFGARRPTLRRASRAPMLGGAIKMKWGMVGRLALFPPTALTDLQPCTSMSRMHTCQEATAPE